MPQKQLRVKYFFVFRQAIKYHKAQFINTIKNLKGLKAYSGRSWGEGVSTCGFIKWVVFRGVGMAILRVPCHSYTSHNATGLKQLVHWFFGGRVAVIQQEISA